MEDKNIQDIKKFVNVSSFEDAKWTIICSLIITIFLPGFVFSVALQTNTKMFDAKLAYILVLSVLNIVFGIITYFKLKKYPLAIFLYNTFSSILFTITFFTLFYFSIYKMAKLTSPVYLISGVLGLLILLLVLFIYRYRVYTGCYENKGGKPNYVVISTAIIPGIVLCKAILSNIGKDKETIIVGFVCLFISYAFSVGTHYLMNFIIGFKYRKEIDFTMVDSEQISTHSKNSKKKRNNKIHRQNNFYLCIIPLSHLW